MRAAVIVAALFLGSCAPKLVEATPAGGVLKVIGNKYGSALQVAQTYCSQHGKDARLGQQNVWNNTIAFDCVKQ